MASDKNGKTVINWKDNVDHEYEKIEIKNQNEAVTTWNQNRAKMDELNEIDQCEWDAYCLTWKPSIVENSKTTTKIKSSNGFVTQHSIPDVIPLPTMQSWAHTQQNIMVDDESELCNIPYMGDENIDKNKSFINGLLTESYYGWVDVGGEYDHYFDDATFIELINSLIPYQNASSECASLSTAEDFGAIGGNDADPKNGQKPFPCEDIFKAISEKFPDKGAPDELRERYVELIELNDADHYVPNVDDPNTENVPSEQKMHSYRSLFCRRCFKYDCTLHRESEEIQSNTNSNPLRSKDMKLSNEPCSPWCYMHMDGKKETQASLDGGSKDTNSNDVFYTMNAEWTMNWTDSDLMLFRSLHEVFSHNYCIIAKTMLTKTCQQVYEFCKNDAINLSAEGVSDTDGANNKQSHKKRKSRKKKQQPSYRRLFSLRKKSGSNEVHSYSPCTHIGPCTDSCTCFLINNYCEKFCGCNKDCSYRFPGCHCKRQCNTNTCPCYVASRECDPDLCRCGAEQIDDTHAACKNVCIQRKQRKHLLIAPSDVAGWGIFLKDSIQKNEFISEYCGEMVSQEEADRRGLLYDKFECSFLFNLNDDFVVDSTRRGNKIRFANHSSNANCYAKVMMVNGDHRIAIYAKRDIQSGEELFFDYRYGPKEQLKFVGIEGKVEFH